MPWTMGAFAVGAVSMIGLPPTAGFVSKWFLILAALEKGQWWLVFLIVGSSLLALAYVWRFVEAAYFREPRQDTANVAPTPWLMSVPTAILVLAIVYFGLDTSFTIGSASEAAAALIGESR